jgi:O-antigen/teichoic acid export membrane protein
MKWAGAPDANKQRPAAPRGSTSPSASVARGALALFSTQPITWAVSLLGVIVVPKHLGDQSLGQFAMVTSVATITGTIALLGVVEYLRRSVAAEPEQQAAQTRAALTLTTGAAVVLGLLVWTVARLAGLPIANGPLFAIALLAVVVTTPGVILAAVLVGQERHARFAWWNAGTATLAPLLGIVVLVLGGGVVEFAAAMLVAALALTSANWATARVKVERRWPSRRSLWILVVGAAPFLGKDLAIQIRNQLDVVLVGTLLSEQAAGWLAAAYRVVGIPVFIPFLVSTPLTPALVRSVNDPDAFRRTLRSSLVAVVALSAGAGGAIFGLAPVVPDLLGWGPSFYSAIPLMMVLALQQPLVAADMVLVNLLVTLRQERRWLPIIFAAAIFNPSANWLAIPLAETWLGNGALGAAIVEVTTELLILLWTLRLVPTGTFDRQTGLRLGGIVGAAIVMVGVMTGMRPYPVPVSLVAAGLLYLTLLFTLRVFTPREVRAVLNVAAQSLGQGRAKLGL